MTAVAQSIGNVCIAAIEILTKVVLETIFEKYVTGNTTLEISFNFEI